MKNGIKISEFLSDGMPVLLRLATDMKLNCDDVMKLFSYDYNYYYYHFYKLLLTIVNIRVMVDRLETNSAFELLFKLNHSFRFATDSYEDKVAVKKLIYFNYIFKFILKVSN